jgi:hypothetical protein
MGPDERTREQVLADKINLLLDALPGEDGKPLTFTAIQAALQERGFALGRTKWHYLKTADARGRADTKFLRALAEVFGVDPGFLLHEDGPLPAQVERELKMLRSMRRAQVRDFAMRALGEIDPDGLQAILNVIEENEASLRDDSGQ